MSRLASLDPATRAKLIRALAALLLEDERERAREQDLRGLR